MLEMDVDALPVEAGFKVLVVEDVGVDVDVDVGGGMVVVSLLLNETASFPSLVFSHAVLIWLHQLLL